MTDAPTFRPGAAARELDARATAPAIADAEPPCAILPVGSFEQHGPHLPVGTDTFVAHAIATRVGAALGALVLPPLPYGTSAEHRGFPGTASLAPATLAAVVDDLATSLAVAGPRRLVVLSGHGGNWVLRPAVRDVNVRHPHLTVGLVPEAVVWADALAPGDLHAGATETALMLHLQPDAVGPLPAASVPDVPREALDLVPLGELSPSGVWGDPQAGADPAAGARVLDGMVVRVQAWITDTFLPLAVRRETAT